jgi:hypothetical protein
VADPDLTPDVVAEPDGASDGRPAPPPLSRVLLGLIVVIAIMLGFGAFLYFRDDDDESRPAGAPAAVAPSQLSALSRRVAHPIYWAGPRRGTTYELTARGADIYVRYLPEGVEIGDRRPRFLTVGTYPFQKAWQALRRSARRKGNTSGHLPDGGIYVVNEKRPTSVYLAWRRSDIQVEVFSPSALEVQRVVRSGQIKPVP